MSLPIRAAAIAGMLGIACGWACSWSRFNQLKEDAPVVRLEPPQFYDTGYGHQLAAAWSDENALLYVAGPAWSRGGMAYDLGLSERPQTYPFDTSHCPFDEGNVSCRAAAQGAGLNSSWAPDSSEPEALCFVSGAAELDGEQGLFTRCASGEQFVLPVPAQIDFELLLSPDEDDPQGLVLATNPGAEQMLLAASSTRGLAWAYPPLSASPQLLEMPNGASSSVGKTAAVARLADQHLLFLGGPSDAQLWVFSADTSGIERLGCLPGPEGFGRALATGDVDGDGAQDVAVASERRVTVLSGALLSLLSFDDESGCSDDSLAAGAALFDVECEPTSNVGGCGGSAYGSSLAIADLGGNGTGFLAVAAPDMKARGENRAGAVFVYDPQGAQIDLLLVSDGDEGDLFGSSVVAVSQAERQILAVGARSARYSYLFYCSGPKDAAASARCD